MDRKTRNVTALGLLVLISGIVFVWGFFYLLGDPVLSGGTNVFVALDNGVGLKRGDRVQLQGVAIGTVRDVVLVPPRRVTVELRLEEALRLPADTRALVRGDVFGAHTVDLLPGSAMVMLDQGDTIRGMAAPPLPQLAQELSEQARTILASTDSLLSPRLVADMHATAEVLPASMRELRSAFRELHRASGSLNRMAVELEQAGNGAALKSTLGALEESAHSLNEAATTLDRSLASLSSVLAKIDGGQGTLGRLVNDSSLYRDLGEAVREMRSLAADVRTNPKKYINVKIF